MSMYLMGPSKISRVVKGLNSKYVTEAYDTAQMYEDLDNNTFYGALVKCRNLDSDKDHFVAMGIGTIDGFRYLLDPGKNEARNTPIIFDEASQKYMFVPNNLWFHSPNYQPVRLDIYLENKSYEDPMRWK